MSMHASTLDAGGAAPRSSVSHTAMAWFGRRIERVRAYVQYRQDLAVMREMDDRMLADAGLTRYDVEFSFRWRR